MRVFHLLFIFVFLNTDASFVKHVTVLFRHGDRTPVQCYPNDPYKNESLWPVPFGQLTNTGKQQQFELGKYLGERYSGTISRQYNFKEVFAQSTDVDRTLMSALVNLAGFFPPSGKEIWNGNISWQPIPVHTVPEQTDEVVAMKKYCASYEIEKKRYFQSQPYLDQLKKYKKFMNYLSSHTGMKVTTFNDIANIYSCLKIEKLYNFTLPAWTEPVFPEKFKKPAGFSFGISAATQRMARLIAGPLVHQIVSTMISVANGTSQLQLSMYSGHDFTVGTLLTALGVFDGQCPEYTATIIFELVFDAEMVFPKDDEPSPLDGYFVRLLYRNSIKLVEPKVINIPGCGDMCSLSMFIKLYSHLITVDWEKECKEVQFPSSMNKELIVIIGITVVFTILLIIHVRGGWNLRRLMMRWLSETVQSRKDQSHIIEEHSDVYCIPECHSGPESRKETPVCLV